MAFRNFLGRFTYLNYANNVNLLKSYYANFTYKSCLTSLVSKNKLRIIITTNINTHSSVCANISTKNVLVCNKKKFNNSSNDSRTVKDLKLMDFNELVWPNVFKTLKNYFLSFLIQKYMDDQFTLAGFLYGAEQAVARVSSSISKGNFEALDGLVCRTAVREIRQNYIELTEEQKRFILINPQDIFLKFVYEIGMIFDDNSHKRFVEITTIMQGYHGLEKIKDENVGSISNEMIANQKQLFICNYRFIREFTRGCTDGWTINKLNHFTPRKLH